MKPSSSMLKRAGCKGPLDRIRARISSPFAANASYEFVAEPIHVAQFEASRAQRFARTDHDLPRRGIEPEHIERLLRRHANPLPLADRVIDDPAMAAENPAVDMDDVPRLGGSRAQALDHFRVAPGGHETDVLAVRLLRHFEAEVSCQLARRILVERAEREPQEGKLLARGGEQEIALVALLVGGAVKLPSAGRPARSAHSDRWPAPRRRGLRPSPGDRGT